MQKLMEKAKRTLFHRHTDLSAINYGHYPRRQPELPPAFIKAHALIIQTAEKIETQTLSGSEDSDLVLPQSGETPGFSTQQAWLPDIYHFSSLGLDVEERYSFALTQPNPFIPMSPRVGENEKFNFDHGELSSELIEETSYMAWF